MNKDKNIILGVTGSIAAYKAAGIIRELVKQGLVVSPVMTKAATHFITPLTLSTLAGHKAHLDQFPSQIDFKVEHISLAKRADLILIAPASANIIGKIANGICDDLLTTVVMASNAPLLIAPAMNEAMYRNVNFRRNMDRLKEQGVRFIEPEEGDLACGEKGRGRLAKVSVIIEAAKDLLGQKEILKGKKLLITAGPTYEPIDPVRYLGNYSSARMGFALAGTALLFGAEVTLVSGPTRLRPPEGVKYISVQTAKQMQKEVDRFFKEVDVFISAAAVSDFRPKGVALEKIKKEGAKLTLELVRNPDILASLGKRKGEKILVGFAAETSSLIERAKEKLLKKNLDLICANQVPASFGEGEVRATLITREEIVNLPELSKERIAGEILKKVARIFGSTLL
ncbi:bifunctional phosphopantothenoylcysteine decarboxylase/phosphopantothenate--cysteine ligase CoaBC [bacterium]|nr:bifunctional phosphopantothenoylcysteine decarboxylase/phosphopantothenate--cysteine ligase CoaBC [bacterium]MBU1613956.1 bifunctional phosphopantothenoylcysteine decarboxylase/phosphopantothenate--cysteine ligase CoaBC [bacterium]